MKTNKHFLNLGVSLATIILFSSAAEAGNLGSSPHMPDLLPPNPQPGVCYARVKIPAQHQTQSHTVVVEDGYSTVEVAQPQLQSRQESVMVKEASVEYRVRQPRYRTVSEQVMVRPSYEKLSVTAPRFSHVTESVRVSEPRLVWKKGNPAKLRAQGYIIHSTADAGYGAQGYRSTTQYGAAQSAAACGTVCEIWCLVEEPGQSVSYTRKVMTSPGEVRRHTVPAKYTTVTKQVVADPGGVEQIPVPAQYRTITVEDVVSAGGERYVNVPPKYGEVTANVPVTSERYEWRQVVCKPGTSGYSSSSYSSGSGYSSGTYGGTTSYSGGSHGTASGYHGTTGSQSYHSSGSTSGNIVYRSGTSHSSGGHYGSSSSCGTRTTCQTYGSSAKRTNYRYRR